MGQRRVQTESPHAASYVGGMGDAIVQLPEQRTEQQRRRVMHAAIRQLERADLYVAAVAYMDLGDAPTERAIERLRMDLSALRGHLSDQRARISG